MGDEIREAGHITTSSLVAMGCIVRPRRPLASEFANSQATLWTCTSQLLADFQTATFGFVSEHWMGPVFLIAYFPMGIFRTSKDLDLFLYHFWTN